MAWLHISICQDEEKPDVLRSVALRLLCSAPLTGTFTGIKVEELQGDPSLGNRRLELINQAIRRLARIRMVDWDSKTGTLKSTDLGINAAKFYIRHRSVEIFNGALKPNMTEADVIGVLCQSTEV